MEGTGFTQAGVSIVCVFNDPTVRMQCLDSSIAGSVAAGRIEYHPIDNVDHRFRTAGAALNEGARRSSHDVVVFVHQDVHLHSVDRLLEAVKHLDSGSWGLLGAAGISGDGAMVGRMRDRVELIGSNADRPAPVESVDEVLFMVRRSQVLESPLTEAPQLSWHGYAVEYGLRMRRRGLPVGALNLGITHNSLTTNLVGLDVAHSYLAEAYPELTPLWTTCGRVSAAGASPTRLRLLRGQRWRYRWWKESVLARGAQRRFPAPAVLRDIRRCVDLLQVPGREPLQVINVDSVGGFTPYELEPLQVMRNGRRFTISSCEGPRGLLSALRRLGSSESALVTNLAGPELDVLATTGLVDPQRSLLGVHEETVWLLMGPVIDKLPREWRDSRAVPMAFPERRLTSFSRGLRPF